MQSRILKLGAGVALAALLVGGAACPAAAEPPRAPPASVGVSQAGLDALNGEFHGLVDQNKLAGIVTLMARKGKVVHFDAYGAKDAATGAPVAKDTIWRIASMTKPVAGVAMMILYEEGRWKLDDPVAKHIPEFANLQVRTADGRLVPQDHPMTMAELMSHTAGFDVSAGYAKAGLADGDLQDMIDKLAKLPLAAQPGADWRYGPSVNIQGYLVEKLSGQSLDAFFQSRIFTPLKMVDTQFWVDPAKRDRVSQLHTYDAQGRITAVGNAQVATSKPKFLSGSGGLYSTAEDYWRFAQMLLNGGELDGVRILKPETVKLMRTNVLKPGVKVDLYGPSQEGVGFGMDFAIIMDPKAAETPQGQDTFYWGGAFGTWFWIDPTNDLVFVGMIQNVDGSRPDAGTPAVRSISYPAVYKTLTGK